MFRFFHSIIFLLVVLFAEAQEDIYPKEEMRAVWLTTVSNLDWPHPSDKGDVEAQKSSLVQLMDSLKRINLNTLFFQVRTECDALYESAYEPWSRFVSGSQGVDPGYDPLAFAIQEAHKRGFELHAWLNPYRINVSNNDTGNYYGEGHIYLEHPEWVITYPDGRKILNPGLEEVQDYIKLIVGDLISKYDLDGVHFDDYFYSYSGTNSSLDDEAYLQYGEQAEARGDFRRRSINQMVAAVYDTINAVKPYLRFGVSPFGIYGNGINPPGIIGLDAYNTIYCDPLAWLSQGTVDYINPQLYWPTGGDQDFGTLLPWWANQVSKYDRHVFTGHGIYRIESNPAMSNFPGGRLSDNFEMNISFFERFQFIRNQDPWNLDQVLRQIEITREHREEGAMGSVYFRTEDLERIEGLKETLKNNPYKYPALTPEMEWKEGEAPDPPSEIVFVKNEETGSFEIRWSHADPSLRFVIYNAKTQDAEADLIAENILGLAYGLNYSPNLNSGDAIEQVFVTTLDRFGRESSASEIFDIPAPSQVKLLHPLDNFALFTLKDSLKWMSAENSTFYEVHLSTDPDFEADVHAFNVKDTLLTDSFENLRGDTQYYWKVRGTNFAEKGLDSEIWSFHTAFPAIPEITYPVHEQTDIALMPEIVFNVTDNLDSVHFQISEGGNDFATYRIIIDTIVSGQSGLFLLEDSLKPYVTYYVRNKGINEYGETEWSEVVKFKTLQPLPNKANVTNPEDKEIFSSTISEIEIVWDEIKSANRYQVQVSLTPDFDPLIVDELVYNGKTNLFLEDIVADSWHYVRVAGHNVGGMGEWSDVVQFGSGTVTSVNEIEMLKTHVVYPTPSADGVFYLKLVGKEHEKVNINLYNLLGSKLTSEKEVSVYEHESYKLDYTKYNCTPCILHVHYVNSGYQFSNKIMQLKN